MDAPGLSVFHRLWTMPRTICFNLLSSEVINAVCAMISPSGTSSSKLDYFIFMYTHIYPPKHPASRAGKDQLKLSITFYQMKRKPKQI